MRGSYADIFVVPVATKMFDRSVAGWPVRTDATAMMVKEGREWGVRRLGRAGGEVLRGGRRSGGQTKGRGSGDRGNGEAARRFRCENRWRLGAERRLKRRGEEMIQPEGRLKKHARYKVFHIGVDYNGNVRAEEGSPWAPAESPD